MHGSGGYATTFSRTVSSAVTPSAPKIGVGGHTVEPGIKTLVTPNTLSMISAEATHWFGGVAVELTTTVGTTVGSTSTRWPTEPASVLPLMDSEADWPACSAIVLAAPIGLPLLS